MTRPAPAGWRAAEPVIPGTHPDPSVCRVGSTYYLVTSSFGYHPGLPVFRSTDLRSWERIGHVLVGESWTSLAGLAVSDGVWAPTIRHHDGVFLVVWTVARERRGSQTLVATARDPAGPWQIRASFDVDGIDPDLFVDTDGRAWLTLARDATAPGRGPGEIWTRELDLETFELVGGEHVLWHGALTGQWVEAPHLYHHEGRYVLVAAEGGTEANHAVTAAVADVVTGPYLTDPRSPLLTHRHLGSTAPVQRVGHADLVEGPDDRWWAVVLAVRPLGGHHTLGRETFLTPVEWEEAGPVLAPGTGRLESDTSVEPGSAPTPEWVSLRGPVTGAVSGEVTGGEGRGAVVSISPRPAGLGGTGVPAFLGIRQDSHRFGFSAAIRCEGITGNDVGIVAFHDERTWAALRVRREAGVVVARVVQRRAGQERELARTTVTGDVELVIRSDGWTYELALSDGRSTRTLASLPHADLSAETAGSFLGVLLGVVNEGHEDSAVLEASGVTYARLGPA